MKRVKNFKRLENGEDYLVFLGYDYSPSGFDVCKFRSDSFETQANGANISLHDGMDVFELPIPETE